MPRRKKSVADALSASRETERLFGREGLDGPSPQGSGSRNPLLDKLVKEIGTYALLKKDELRGYFREVDDHYTLAISLLAQHTCYLETVVADNVAEVLGGITNGRIVHNLPTDTEDKDPVWSTHTEFLSLALETLASRLLVPKTQDYTADVCRLRLVGSSVFNSLDRYADLGLEYLDLSSRLTQAMLAEYDSRKERKLALSSLQKSMRRIAQQMRTKEDDIPILTRHISVLVERVRKIHRTLFNHHLRLLIKVSSSNTTDNDQLLDNFQAGSFGLMRAIKDYVPPYNFIGYASGWIRQAVLGSMRTHSNTIRIPGNVLQEYSSLEKTRHTLSGDATLEDLAKHTKQDIKKIQRIYDLVQLAHTYSLDREINAANSDVSNKESGPTTLKEIIPDTNDNEEKENQISRVREYLGILDDRERWIVCLFFGLLDYLPHQVEVPCKDVVIQESSERERLRQLLMTANLRIQRLTAASTSRS